MEKVYLSLTGLSVGDAFGEMFFNPQAAQWIQNRQLPEGSWRWTDDTHMALSIVDVLQQHGTIQQDVLVRGFARRFMQDGRLGYGGGARQLLERVYYGEDWRKVSVEIFNGGSYGNGAAMRVPPLGAYFAGDPRQAAEQARLSAEVTHAHPEGQAGAIAVAVAASLAAVEGFPQGMDFLKEILSYVPEGLTSDRLRLALEIPAGDVDEAAARLGTGQDVSAMDTVPFCLWVAAYNLMSYEDALWMTVSGLGDRDTTCAIVGGIVAVSSKVVPEAWIHHREPLPLLKS